MPYLWVIASSCGTCLLSLLLYMGTLSQSMSFTPSLLLSNTGKRRAGRDTEGHKGQDVKERQDMKERQNVKERQDMKERQNVKEKERETRDKG